MVSLIDVLSSDRVIDEDECDSVDVAESTEQEDDEEESNPAINEVSLLI